jgi:DNA polymerase-4
MSICNLFDEIWDKKPIRQLGVCLSDLEYSNVKQMNIFQDDLSKKNEVLDKAVDKIRTKYGDQALMRGIFANSDFKPLLGGYPDDEYPGMSSIL